MSTAPLRAAVAQALTDSVADRGTRAVGLVVGADKSTVSRWGTDLRSWPADALLAMAATDPAVRAALVEGLSGDAPALRPTDAVRDVHVTICALGSEVVSAHPWHIHGAGYAASTIKVDGAWKTRTLHRFLLGLPILPNNGCPTTGVVDHINGDKLDNRRANLRVCTTSVNNANGRPMRICSSGIRGVHFDALTGKWCASWMAGGKREWHRFATKAEAAACRAEFNASANLPNADIRKSA